MISRTSMNQNPDVQFKQKVVVAGTLRELIDLQKSIGNASVDCHFLSEGTDKNDMFLLIASGDDKKPLKKRAAEIKVALEPFCYSTLGFVKEATSKLAPNFREFPKLDLENLTKAIATGKFDFNELQIKS